MSEAARQALHDEIRPLLRSYVKAVKTVFGSSLDGVILYGSVARGDFLPGRSNINLVLLLVRHDVALLQAYAKTHRRWAKEHVVVPLFITASELQHSAHLFPLEYLEIKECHLLLDGRDPFLDLRIDLVHLRVQCQQELHGNLLRLRQRFVEGGGKPEAVGMLLPLSVTSLVSCLRGLFATMGVPAKQPNEDVLQAVQVHLGIDPRALLEAWRLKRGLISPGTAEVPRLFERYVSTLETLVERVEQGHKL